MVEKLSVVIWACWKAALTVDTASLAIALYCPFCWAKSTLGMVKEAISARIAKAINSSAKVKPDSVLFVIPLLKRCWILTTSAKHCETLITAFESDGFFVPAHKSVSSADERSSDTDIATERWFYRLCHEAFRQPLEP